MVVPNSIQYSGVILYMTARDGRMCKRWQGRTLQAISCSITSTGKSEAKIRAELGTRTMMRNKVTSALRRLGKPTSCL